MRWLLNFACIVLLLACGPVPRPDSIRTVAAYEVPLPSADDRRAFLSVLSEISKTSGLHVDSATDEELASTAKVIPEARMTIHAAIWRGERDEESIATIMDGYDHLGLVWIMFVRGEDEVFSAQFRERVMTAVKLRWPGTVSLPIAPSGAIPHHEDMIRTPEGYIINPAAASRYEATPADR